MSSRGDAETISKSPSPSTSATFTSWAPSAFVAISAAVNVGLAAPSFSYQAIVSSSAEAEMISKSPSPSISTTVIPLAPSADVDITEEVKEGFSLPSFLNHLIESSSIELAIISISPSLSISATWTSYAPSTLEVIISSAKFNWLLEVAYSTVTVFVVGSDKVTVNWSIPLFSLIVLFWKVISGITGGLIFSFGIIIRVSSELISSVSSKSISIELEEKLVSEKKPVSGLNIIL